MKKDFVIPVECCSCRVSKILEYLEEINEVWVIVAGACPWEEPILIENGRLFVFKKSYNWNRYLKFKKERFEELKQIKNPIDRLYGEEG